MRIRPICKSLIHIKGYMLTSRPLMQTLAPDVRLRSLFSISSSCARCTLRPHPECDTLLAARFHVMNWLYAIPETLIPYTKFFF
jgi:hypothetical protein